MPIWSRGYGRDHAADAARKKRKAEFAAKAHAKGIMKGSNGWLRYMAAHGC